jgi:hypothetical protein
MTKYSKKELWLHKILECIYEESGMQEIENLIDIVQAHSHDDELVGEILDFSYDKREAEASKFFSRVER